MFYLSWASWGGSRKLYTYEEMSTRTFILRETPDFLWYKRESTADLVAMRPKSESLL